MKSNFGGLQIIIQIKRTIDKRPKWPKIANCMMSITHIITNKTSFLTNIINNVIERNISRIQQAQKRINLLSQKYKRYCQRIRGNERWKGWQILQKLIWKCSSCWTRLTPVSVRGWASQYEQFNHLWKSEIGKQCSNGLVTSKSIEQCFVNEQKKTVLGLLYTKQSIKKMISFLNSIPLEMTNKQFTICPINIESEYFEICFQDKVGYYDESVIILWRGLFNEIIVLGRIRTNQAGLCQQIERITDERSKYESKIKQKAFFSQNNNSLDISK